MWSDLLTGDWGYQLAAAMGAVFLWGAWLLTTLDHDNLARIRAADEHAAAYIALKRERLKRGPACARRL